METVTPPSRDDMLALTSALTRLDTVNPPGNEQLVADHLAELVSGSGIDAEVVEISDGRANLEMKWTGTGDAQALVYCGHFDTVPLGERPWSNDPHGARCDGEYLWGRGTVDMKGGVAAMVLAMMSFAKSGLRFPGDIRFLECRREAGISGYTFEYQRDLRCLVRSRFPEDSVHHGPSPTHKSIVLADADTKQFGDGRDAVAQVGLDIADTGLHEISCAGRIDEH